MFRIFTWIFYFFIYPPSFSPILCISVSSTYFSVNVSEIFRKSLTIRHIFSNRILQETFFDLHSCNLRFVIYVRLNKIFLKGILSIILIIKSIFDFAKWAFKITLSTPVDLFYQTWNSIFIDATQFPYKIISKITFSPKTQTRLSGFFYSFLVFSRFTHVQFPQKTRFLLLLPYSLPGAVKARKRKKSISYSCSWDRTL